jgi:hypothetical protein
MTLTTICKNHALVIIEDLNVKGMSASACPVSMRRTDAGDKRQAVVTVWRADDLVTSAQSFLAQGNLFNSGYFVALVEHNIKFVDGTFNGKVLLVDLISQLFACLSAN